MKSASLALLVYATVVVLHYQALQKNGFPAYVGAAF
jgi:hypothetical protein